MKVSNIKNLYADSTICINKDKYNITMIDPKTGQLKKTNCFWCRNPFDGECIGCPISYTPSKYRVACTTDITQERYTVNQDISNHTDKKEHIETNDYYTTIGCFCSFNCCVAYIQDNLHEPLLANSHSLLMNIYRKMNPPTPGAVYDLMLHPAHHWELLKDYGGHMTIDEFRGSFQKVAYDPKHFIIDDIPKLHPRGSIYAEKYII